MPSLIILIPLIGLIILNLPLGNFVRRSAFWFAIAIFVIQIAIAVFHHLPQVISSIPAEDPFLKVSFRLDHLTLIMFVCIGVVSLASLLAGRHSIANESEEFKFINLLIIASAGMSGIVMVTDIFSLYVFLEITAIASFILIAFNKDVYALEGAFKYLVLSAVATVLMLTSIALLFMLSGSTSFSVIAAMIGSSNHNLLAALSVAIFLCGLFIKGGLVPFHGWVPDAYMSSPGPVSILLAGIVTKAAGIYTLIRIVSVFGFTDPIKNMLMVVGAISILYGAITALTQVDFKRMLAYSSISQVGYIVLGLGIGTPLGIAGAVFHLFNHSIFKSLLFVNSAALEKEVGTSDMTKMGGLSSRMPVTGATSLVGFLSTCGMPPLSGFWSKLIIVIALWQTSHYAYAAIAVLASLLTLAYFLMMQRNVFFGKLRPGLENVNEAGFPVVLASSALAAITVGVGIFFPAIYNNYLIPLKELLIK